MKRQDSRRGLRILLVDPHDELRAALERRLKSHESVDAVAATPDFAEAAGLIPLHGVNVVLLDPGRDGAAAEEAVRTLSDLRRMHRFALALHVPRYDIGLLSQAKQLAVDLCLLKGLPTASLIRELEGAVHHSLTGHED